MRFLSRESQARTREAARKTRRAWFGRVTSMFRGQPLDEELWESLEEALISSDIGVSTAMELLERVREDARSASLDSADGVIELLKQQIADTLQASSDGQALDLDETPAVVLMVGVNGAGKTTSIAKLANAHLGAGRSVILGAADTFRAAGIEQLQEWGTRLRIDVIAHRSGGDPGAVAFDTIQAARARNADVAIIDTAGRLQNKTNLMQELRKVHRISEQQAKGRAFQVLLALDATTGQNGLIQARSFTEAVRCDGVFLAKLDGSSKGGIVVAIASELGLPVLYVGTGESPEDIAAFEPREFADALFEEDQA